MATETPPSPAPTDLRSGDQPFQRVHPRQPGGRRIDGGDCPVVAVGDPQLVEADVHRGTDRAGGDERQPRPVAPSGSTTPSSVASRRIVRRPAASHRPAEDAWRPPPRCPGSSRRGAWSGRRGNRARSLAARGRRAQFTAAEDETDEGYGGKGAHPRRYSSPDSDRMARASADMSSSAWPPAIRPVSSWATRALTGRTAPTRAARSRAMARSLRWRATLKPSG